METFLCQLSGNLFILHASCPERLDALQEPIILRNILRTMNSSRQAQLRVVSRNPHDADLHRIGSRPTNDDLLDQCAQETFSLHLGDLIGHP